MTYINASLPGCLTIWWCHFVGSEVFLGLAVARPDYRTKSLGKPQAFPRHSWTQDGQKPIHVHGSQSFTVEDQVRFDTWTRSCLTELPLFWGRGISAILAKQHDREDSRAGRLWSSWYWYLYLISGVVHSYIAATPIQVSVVADFSLGSPHPSGCLIRKFTFVCLPQTLKLVRSGQQRFGRRRGK